MAFWDAFQRLKNSWLSWSEKNAAFCVHRRRKMLNQKSCKILINIGWRFWSRLRSFKSVMKILYLRYTRALSVYNYLYYILYDAHSNVVWNARFLRSLRCWWTLKYTPLGLYTATWLVNWVCTMYSSSSLSVMPSFDGVRPYSWKRKIGSLIKYLLYFYIILLLALLLNINVQ